MAQARSLYGGRTLALQREGEWTSVELDRLELHDSIVIQ